MAKAVSTPTLDYGIATLAASGVGLVGIVWNSLAKGHQENRRAHDEVRRMLETTVVKVDTVHEDISTLKDGVFDVNDKLDDHIRVTQAWDQRNEARMARSARRRAFFGRYF